MAIVAIVAASSATAEVGRRAVAGTLPRNRLAGIRTRATLADDVAWRTAHRAGGPWLHRAGLAGLTVGLAAVPVALVGSERAAAAVVVLAALVLVVGSVAAGVVGVAAAQRGGASG